MWLDRRSGHLRHPGISQSGNQPLTLASHSASLGGAPLGTIPAACAAVVYFRTVLRSSTPSNVISLLFRLAYQ